MGLIPSLSVQVADRADPDSAKWVRHKVAVTATGLILIWAEGGDGGKFMAWGQDICDWRLEIVKGWNDATGAPYTFRPSHPGLPPRIDRPSISIVLCICMYTLQFSRITIAQRKMFQVRFKYCFFNF